MDFVVSLLMIIVELSAIFYVSNLCSLVQYLSFIFINLINSLVYKKVCHYIVSSEHAKVELDGRARQWGRGEHFLSYVESN